MRIADNLAESSVDQLMDTQPMRVEDGVGSLRDLALPPLNTNTLPEGANGGDAEPLPPLREIIWRRLRRRNAQLNQLDQEIGSETGREQRSRHREMLSWMVDQMQIDQQQQQRQQQHAGSGGSAEPPSTARANDQIPVANSDSLSAAIASSARASARTSESPTSASASATAASAPVSDAQAGSAEAPRYRTHRAARQALLNDLNLRNRNRARVDIRHYQFLHRAQDNFFQHNLPPSMALTHRIQAWDFAKGDIPDISDPVKNIIVAEAKIHNDASVDISADGTVLVTLVPSNMPVSTVVGVYGLKAGCPTRGACYATFHLESSAVSVSLSPTSKHLLVGLTTRAARMSISPADRGLMAQIFRIQLPWERKTVMGRLIHKRDVPQVEQGQTALNCIRWIPVPGQGMVYATNTGLLKILR